MVFEAVTFEVEEMSFDEGFLLVVQEFFDALVVVIEPVLMDFLLWPNGQLGRLSHQRLELFPLLRWESRQWSVGSQPVVYVLRKHATAFQLLQFCSVKSWPAGFRRCMHACIHPYIHACMHTCIHTHMHSQRRKRAYTSVVNNDRF